MCKTTTWQILVVRNDFEDELCEYSVSIKFLRSRRLPALVVNEISALNAMRESQWTVMQHGNYTVHYSTYYCLCHTDENRLPNDPHKSLAEHCHCELRACRWQHDEKVPCLFMNLSTSRLLSPLHVTQLIIVRHNLLIRSRSAFYFGDVQYLKLIFEIKEVWKTDMVTYDSKHNVLVKRTVF